MMAVPELFLLALVFVPVNFVTGNVTRSSTLSTNDRDPFWVSSSGEFAFGFRQINNITNLFSLAIWYNRIPDMTIVWSAKADNLVVAPPGSEVQLTSGGLTLTTPNGEAIWTAEPNGTVSYGAMLDTGNFVLANRNSTSVWESFKNPTDTLLPTQYLELDNKLSSRLAETNYTNGRFDLYFNNGSLFLSPLAWPTPNRYHFYYTTGASNSASRLVFDQSADVYIEDTNGSKIQLDKWNRSSALDPDAYYYRATLDFNGVFTLYSHPRSSNGDQRWSIVSYVPDNICIAIFNDMGSGCCGFNSYCSMENQRPTCRCPYGYSLIDPNNQFGGCQPNFTLGCGADVHVDPEELYGFTVLKDVDWPLGDYEKLQPCTQDDCQKSCLHDCSCAVAVFHNQTCWKKKLPLANGRAQSGGQLPLIKTRLRLLANLDPAANNDDPSGDSGEKNKDTDKPILLGSLIGSLVVNGLFLASVIFGILLMPKKIVQASSLLDTNLHSFTYKDLEEATQGFKEEAGRGSFGIVYKGTLKSGSNTVVAVKKLDRLAQEREKEFKSELSAIGKTCHKNLVRLIGFCDEGVHRLLVYEFMSNGNLADILFGKAKPVWNLRIKIALEIARGLVYLHEECDTSIIHCDIKPQNILLNGHFTAKISDFGLAKLLLSDQSRTNTMIRGTRGYVAPEWFKNVPVTVKVDVYSFGIMLLEIICCRRSVLMESVEEERGILTDWAYDCYMRGRIDALVEEDREAMADKDRLQKWVMIALWCIQEHQEMRPAMKTVMQMLEGLVEVPNPPSPSSLTST